MRRKKAGFTLVELLVVVGIIALLVTLLMPALGRAMELARRTICQTQLGNMGRAWMLYFREYDNKLPQMHNVNLNVPDCLAQFTFMVYCGNPRHTTGRPDYVNAGALYKEKLLNSEQVYVCPSVQRNWGQPWFDNETNYWPVNRRQGTYMTYQRRRMNYYDNPGISDLGWQTQPPGRGDEDVMLYYAGVDTVVKPGDFSWMSDRFDNADWAMLSHPPGVNLQWLDGHASYWEDTTPEGEVLYDNGLGEMGWSGPMKNWYIDDIWMIFDGYHQPPVGQGH